ncbi:hypothetical protein [Anaplasma bovis]|uniref:hypothetical protein n=1 Tax=Anaplasma bovis TaxID=186733 RepID=UPI002FEED0BA
MKEKKEHKSSFHVEIRQQNEGFTTRYYGKIDVKDNNEFDDIFWIEDGFGAFEFFSGRLFKENGIYKAVIDSEVTYEHNVWSSSIDLKQVRWDKEKDEYELCEVNGGKTTLVVRALQPSRAGFKNV